MSKLIDYKGGGAFKYYELESYEDALKNCEYILDKDESTENKLMNELMKVKSELDIATSQLKGKCLCCKHLQQGIIHISEGTMTYDATCDKLIHRDLREDCEHWELRLYVEN